MEEHVGMIANNPNYKLEELERIYGSEPPTYSGEGDNSAIKNYVSDHEDAARL